MVDRNSGNVAGGRKPNGAFARDSLGRPRGTHLKVTLAVEELLDGDAEKQRLRLLKVWTASEKQRTTLIRRRYKLPNANAARDSATGVYTSKVYGLSAAFATRVSEKKTIWSGSKPLCGQKEAAPRTGVGTEAGAAIGRTSYFACIPSISAEHAKRKLNPQRREAQND